jgi:trk system potassium uptake protein
LANRIIHNVLNGLGQSAHDGEILVVGLGRFGSSLARTLVDMGYEVLGVDFDAERVQDLSDVLTHVVQADSTSEKALRQLGAADVDTAVVCIGTDVESSVLTTAALIDIGVTNVWAKAITDAHGRILQRVGANHVVFPEAEMGSRVAHLVTGSLLEYVALDEDFVLVETVVPPAYVDTTLGESGIRAKYRVTVVCIKPEGAAFTYAEPQTVLGPRDLIVVAGYRADVERFAERASTR